MFRALTDWFETRTGYRTLLRGALDEPIPGGARWKYVWGSALAVSFLTQAVTGLLLMLSYSPSSSTAWGSVLFINERMWGGWFLRGVHHFGAQAMVVLLALHLVQVVWAGAYRAPREMNWWFGVALMVLTLGFALTGYLLPWDQKGYWATKVATNIMGGAPVVGPALQRVVGGDDYGNQTLTRFYGLHVGILPVVMVACLAVHVALFRKHGVTTPRGVTGSGRFWPEQLFRDTAAAFVVFGLLALLVVCRGGADLDAPADPTSADYPARPEWYFLALFQMLKAFPGKLEVVGTVIIPGMIMTALLLLPLLDKVLPARAAGVLARGFVVALLGGAGLLSATALREDAADSRFQAARRQADRVRDRALQLALTPGVGIPPEGGGYVLFRDPLHHGRAVLEARCLGCHYYGGEGQGAQQTASDLKGFGTRAWVRGLLENPKAASYYGQVPGCKGMARWKTISKLSAQELDVVADFVASFATVSPETTPAEWLVDPKVVRHPGLKPFVRECGRCHVVPGLTQGGIADAPALFAWGSSQWVARMVKKPEAPDLFGFLPKAGRMVSFDGQLTDNDLTTLVRFLKGDYLPERVPHGATSQDRKSRAPAWRNREMVGAPSESIPGVLGVDPGDQAPARDASPPRSSSREPPEPHRSTLLARPGGAHISETAEEVGMCLKTSNVNRRSLTRIAAWPRSGSRPPAHGGTTGLRAAKVGWIALGLTIGISTPAPADGLTSVAHSDSRPAKASRPPSGPVVPVQVYRAVCVKCHERDGRGKAIRQIMPELPDFTDPKWQDSRSDAELTRSILEGKGKWMRPMGTQLGSVGVEQMAAFIRAFRGGRQEIADDPGPRPGAARESRD